MQGEEVGKVVLVEGIGLAEIAAGIQLVVPNFLRGCALVEEEDDGLHACPLEHTAGEVEDGVEVALLQEQLTECRGIAVAEEGVLDDDASPATRLEHLDEVLHEHVGSLGGVDVEVLLHLASFAATKGRIGKNHVLAVFLLNLRKVLCQCVATDDVGCCHTVENHVHGGDDVGQRLLLLAEEGVLLQGLVVGSALHLLVHVGERLAEETSRPTGRVIHRFANLGVNHSDDGADERTGRVVLASVAPGVAHLGNLALVEQGHFVLVFGGLEVQLVDEVDDLAQVVARGDFVAQFGKNLSNLILQGLGTRCRLLKLAQSGEEFAIHKLSQVRPRHGIHRVGRAVSLLGCSPLAPAHIARDDGLVGLAAEQGIHGLLLLQVVEILEKEQPRGLLDVVQFGAASCFVAQDVVDGIERLFVLHRCNDLYSPNKNVDVSLLLVPLFRL